ncbi:MAG: Gldg family protein, partial [Akkermansiaceae bacterium]
MAKDQQANDEEPVRSAARESVNRVSTGTLVAIQLLCGWILFVSINYLAATNHKAWDLSQNKHFTLSTQTASLLKSSLLKDREKPVQIIAVVRRSSVHYVRLHAMLEEYQRLAGGKLTLEFVDPIRDTDATLGIAATYDTSFVEDVVIINAAPPVSPLPEDAEDREDHARRMETLTKSHIRYVAVQDMLVFGADTRLERRLIGYQDEDQLSSAIRRAIEGTPRKFYLLADKSQIAGQEEDAPWDFLSRTFKNLNIELVPVRVSGMEKIPEDAAGVALVAPRYDLDQRELAVFR